MNRKLVLVAWMAASAVPLRGWAAEPSLDQEIAELRARVADLQAQLAQQGAQSEELRARLAALQSALSQLDQERTEIEASRVRSVEALEDAIDLLTQARQVVEIGMDDATVELDQASERFALAAEEGRQYGNPPAERALAAIADVRAALDRNDVQDAKKALDLALFHAYQARALAEAQPRS
jgi:chromosome segregation ATPase